MIYKVTIHEHKGHGYGAYPGRSAQSASEQCVRAGLPQWVGMELSIEKAVPGARSLLASVVDKNDGQALASQRAALS
eukprot:1615323-Pleurochrysis_carterae.AAC.1